MHKTVSPLRENKWNLERDGGWESVMNDFGGGQQLTPGEMEPGKHASYAGEGV